MDYTVPNTVYASEKAGENAMQEQMCLGQSFPTLGARIIYAYLAAYPPYMPDPSMADEESRRQLHAFLYEMLKTCYDHPELIGIEPEADKCFAERWHLNNSNPALMDAMTKVEKKFFDWVGTLYKLVQAGQAAEDHLFIAKSAWKLTPKTLDKWAAFGLAYEPAPEGVILRCPKYPLLFPAMKKRSEDASQPGGQVIEVLTRFLLGAVPGRPLRAAQMFGKLYGDAAFLEQLESFFEKLGYTLTNGERWLQVRWEKEYRDKERGYMNISFRWRDRLQMCFEFRVPAFRRLLGHYDQMEYALGELCYTRTKICDNCGYCTQTDKSGKREKLALPLKYPGGVTLKCPLWPWFTWNELNEETLEKIKKLFLFAEEKLYGQ